MEIDPTVSGLLIAAVTSMAGVITYLWKQLTNQFNSLQKRSDECDEDRKELWKALYSIKGNQQ
jgi:hypothetical protein